MKISVIIPVYNAEKYVQQAVESALQFEKVYEVILVEDGSPDNVLSVCERLRDQYPRVKLFQHADKKNHGAGASRNLGIANASGDFIAFLDADDYYLSNRFDAEKELFARPEVDGVYGALGVEYYTESSRHSYHSVFGNGLTTVYKHYPPEDVFPGQLQMRGSFGLFSIDTLTLRRSSLINKMDVLFKDLSIHEDSEFFFRLSYYLKLYGGILDRAIAMRGVHDDNRITAVETKKIKPCTTKILLWKEIKTWADTESTLPEASRVHIERMYRSFEIANASLWKKMRMILTYLIRDYPSIRCGLYNINFRLWSTQIFWK
ncbi:glycosyltransferase [Chryseobacterium nematophagum]|uniref:Glycosyltransferase n=3 Tax=Chryseobacterium nematophagum TaxID=2305228 RepID=A0A3M7TLS2_9FLAO|nr:glycosyltransferase [Chryseobacterium nematophagum]RNA64016.1 glycosyltransferase [Chryseobacterium nematophagum]